MVDQWTFIDNLTTNPTDGSNIWNVGHGGDFTFYIESTASGGTIQFETARIPHFPGNWAPIGSGPVTVSDGTQILQLEGALFCIRARVTTPSAAPMTIVGMVDY
jgi:hypothetical protein